MKNITITLEESVLRRARIEAAKSGKSLSRWIGEVVKNELAPALPDNKSSDWLDAPLWPSRKESFPSRGSQRETLTRFLAAPDFPGVTDDLPSRNQRAT